MAEWGKGGGGYNQDEAQPVCILQEMLMGFNQPSYHDIKVRAIQKCPKTNMSEAGAVVRRQRI